MNVVIIEDEMPAFKRLHKLVSETIPEAQLAAHLESISASEEWFSKNAMPDLVFLDVHLADGSAFDLLKKISLTCPLIFTTAYDEYAIKAYKTQSIDYLLKPVKKEELEQAILKLNQMRNYFDDHANDTHTQPKEYKKRFLIRFGEHIKTLPVTDIAYCYSENKATFAKTFDGRTHPMDHNLDALETLLDPQDFFRINRQYLISVKAIDEMRTYTKARVIVRLHPPVKEPPVVSSERAADFKNWLGGDK